MTDEDSLEALAADYRSKGWRIGTREHGVFYAWYSKVPRGPNGLMDLRDTTVAGLRARVETFEAVFLRTNSREQAEHAATGLNT